MRFAGHFLDQQHPEGVEPYSLRLGCNINKATLVCKDEVLPPSIFLQVEETGCEHRLVLGPVLPPTVSRGDVHARHGFLNRIQCLARIAPNDRFEHDGEHEVACVRWRESPVTFVSRAASIQTSWFFGFSATFQVWDRDGADNLLGWSMDIPDT